MIEEVQQPNALLVHQENEDGGLEASILITPYDGNPGISISQAHRSGDVFVLVEGLDDFIRALRRAAKEQRARLAQVDLERRRAKGA